MRLHYLILTIIIILHLHLGHLADAFIQSNLKRVIYSEKEKFNPRIIKIPLMKSKLEEINSTLLAQENNDVHVLNCLNARDSPHTCRPRRRRGSCCTCRTCRLAPPPSAAAGCRPWCSAGRTGYWKCARSRLRRNSDVSKPRRYHYRCSKCLLVARC